MYWRKKYRLEINEWAIMGIALAIVVVEVLILIVVSTETLTFILLK